MSHTLPRSRGIPATVVTGATALLLLGCPEQRQREPLPDWRGGLDVVDAGTPTDAGVTADAAVPVERYALRPVRGLGYDVRLRATDTASAPCELTPDGTLQGFERLDCTLDINELDLYGIGLDFDFIVPEGLCEFVVYGHYRYEAFEVGTGPTEVLVETDASGTIVHSEGALYGEPYCAFDHSVISEDAPNCCLGSYTLTRRNVDTGVEQVSGPHFWGGRPADCYNGAGFWDSEATLSDDGWPMDKIVFIAEKAWAKRIHFDALSSRYVTNVVLASYFDPDQHLPGGAPAGLLGAFARGTSVFQCYDHAEELLAELTLTVREWNEEREFYADGDPDTSGSEPVSQTPINDRRDWADATPGSASFIGLAQ